MPLTRRVLLLLAVTSLWLGHTPATHAAAPDAILLGTSTIAENQPAATIIGTLTALDADPGDTHTFLIVENVQDLFAIDGADLVTTAPFDYESAASRTIRIRATDAGGAWIERQFIITILDRNDAPTGVALSVTGVAEDTALDTRVGTISPLGDPDRGDAWTYALLDDGDGHFALEGTFLRLAAPLDYETMAVARLRIQITDLAGATAITSFDLRIFDRNESPQGVRLVLGPGGPISEASAPGSVAGHLEPVGDPDAGDRWTYEIIGGTAAAKFAIDGDALVTLVALDYETAPVLVLSVRVTDQGGKRADGTLLILVADANDPPTAVALDTSGVAENAPAGTLVGSLVAQDPDRSDSHTFELVSGPGFALDGNRLVTTAALDHEATPKVRVVLRVIDHGGLELLANLDVVVLDVNEAPTALALSVASVAENSPPGTLVGLFATTDPDLGDTASYYLVDNGGGGFRIEGATLRVVGALDFEKTPTRTILVRTIDGGPNGGLSFDRSFVINVLDVDETATAIGLDTTSVRENQPPGTVVAHLSPVGDPDLMSGGYTYALIQNAGNWFDIVGDTLVTTASLDFETLHAVQLGLRATATSGDGIDMDVTIAVLDEPEAPTGLSASSTSIPEGRAKGTFIATLAATGDPDAGEQHTFTLVSNPGALFDIKGATLVSAAVFDYEAADTHPIVVRATDRAGLYVDVPLLIHVLDANDPPTGVTISSFVIPEDTAVATTIGVLSAVGDPDPGEHFTYELTSAPAGRFQIVNNALVLLKAVDFETGQIAFRIQVRVHDSGDLTADQNIDLTVTNVNEPPAALTLDKTTVVENKPSGTLIGTIGGGLDPDAGDSANLVVVSPAAGFAIDPQNRLVTTSALDHDATPIISVTVRKSDTGGLSAEGTWPITITNVNEPPTGVGLDTLSVSEAVLPGGLVGNLTTLGDPDAADPHTFSLSVDFDEVFAVSGNRLVVAAPLDFEHAATHDIWITTTDQAGLSASSRFTITVTDANDAPSLAVITAALPAIAEDDPNPAGVSLAELFLTLGVVDQDWIAAAGGAGGTGPGGAPVLPPTLVVDGLDVAHGAWQFSAPGAPTTWSTLTVGTALAASAGRLRFVPAPDYSGTILQGLVVHATDGQADSATSATLSLTIDAINDPPTLTILGPIQAFEATPVTIPIELGDVDAPSLAVTLQAPELVFAVATEPPPGVAVDIDHATGNVTLTGKLDKLQAALQALVVTPIEGLVGETSLLVTADDLGHSGAGGPQTATASVGVTVAPAPDLVVTREGRALASEAIEDLGSLGLGAWHITWFEVENRGAQDLLLGEPRAELLVDPGNSQLEAAVLVAPDALIPPGQTSRMAVALRADAVGPLAATLHLYSNDLAPPDTVIHLVGTAADAPHLVVSAGTRTLWSGLGHVVPDLVLAAKATELTFTLANVGDAAIEFGTPDVVSTTNARVNVLPPFPTLEAHHEAVLSVFIDPIGAGRIDTTIELPSTDPETPRFLLRLTGTATVGQVPHAVVQRLPGILLADGASDDLGTLVVGSETPIALQIHNLGSRPLALDKLAVAGLASAGGAAPTVRIGGDVAASIAPGASESIAVFVAPDAGPTTFELRLGNARWEFLAIGSDVAATRALRVHRWGGELISGDDRLGAVDVGLSQVVGYVLENASAERLALTLPITAHDPSGLEAVPFPQPEAFIAPYAGAVLPVTLTPTEIGAVRVDLDVDRSPESQRTMRIRSDGQVGAAVVLTADDAPIDPGATVSLSLVTPGKELVYEMAVSNGGTGPLTVASIAFALGAGPACERIEVPDRQAKQLDQVLAPSERVPFKVTLLPVEGAFTCDIVVTSDDPEAPTTTFTLAGRGLPIPVSGCSGGSGTSLVTLLAALALIRSRRRRAP